MWQCFHPVNLVTKFSDKIHSPVILLLLIIINIINWLTSSRQNNDNSSCSSWMNNDIIVITVQSVFSKRSQSLNLVEKSAIGSCLCLCSF